MFEDSDVETLKKIKAHRKKTRSFSNRINDDLSEEELDDLFLI